MKKILNITLIIMLLAWSYYCFASETQTNNICSESPPSLICFKQNFSQIYQSNYDLFWDTYNVYKKKAETCDNLNMTADFLEVSSYIGGNAEVEEGFHEFCENLILSKTKCFIEATLLLQDKTLDVFIKSYVSNSFFGQDEQINKAFIKYSHVKEYVRFFNIYNKYKKEKKT
ncbi:MAG: hypothetical protein ACMUJM_24715 [bacterium]